MRRIGFAVLWTLAAFTLLALAWGCAVLYVQSAAARDVAALKRSLHYAPNPDGLLCPVYDETTFNRIRDLHGCRALPSLVAELDPAADHYYNHTISNLIRIAVAPAFRRDPEGPWAKGWHDLDDLWYEQAVAPDERTKKIERLRAWWRAEGHKFHQPWRFWSTKCGTALAKDF